MARGRKRGSQQPAPQRTEGACDRCGKRTTPDRRLHHTTGGTLCVVCWDAYRKALASNDPGVRADYYARTYGMAPTAYREMFADQAGRCAICGRTQEQVVRPFVVDHNHASGRVRGLLCHPCNSALGMLGDNPAIVDRAAEYLRQRGFDQRYDARPSNPRAERRISKRVIAERLANLPPSVVNH